MTEIEPDRWPPFVRAFVDNVGVNHSGVTISVRYSMQPPLWQVTAGCPQCGTQVFWTILAPPPLEPVVVSGPTPIPDWLYKLNDLPPGGTE